MGLFDKIFSNRPKEPKGFEGGASIDFAAAFWCWTIFHLTVSLKWFGVVAAGLLAFGMCVVNFIRIRKVK
jgi:hypothetical protein